MSINISGPCIVIHGKREKKSKFSKMKNYFREKIGQLMYAVREKASKIVINGKSIVADPNDYPIELKMLSIKQLGKIQRALIALNAGADGGDKEDGTSMWRPGIIPPFPSPRDQFDDEDVDIEVNYGCQRADGVPVKSHSAVVMYNKSTSSIKHSYNPEAVGDDMTDDNTTHGTEIPFEVKKLMRKNRPKAAKGERSTTVIPSYIIIDEDEDIRITPQRRKRPTAAKGERKRPAESSDLFDLPVDVLVDTFKEPSSVIKPKERKRPDAPRGRIHSFLEDNTELPGMVAISKDEITSNEEERVADGSESLEELLLDLGITTTRKPKEQVNVRYVQVKECEDKEDDIEDESDDDIFNVPYLPKSQRTAAFGNSFPWKR